MLPKFAVKQSETSFTIMISCGIKSLILYGFYDIIVTWLNLVQYSKYLAG